MTALDVIKRALRMLGVVDANEAPEAEDAQDGLDLLNALFAEWRGADIMVPDFEVEAPDSELTISLADKEAVAHQLAKRISPEYGTTLSPEAQDSLREAWNRFMLRYFQPGTVSFDELPCDTGRREFEGRD